MEGSGGRRCLKSRKTKVNQFLNTLVKLQSFLFIPICQLLWLNILVVVLLFLFFCCNHWLSQILDLNLYEVPADRQHPLRVLSSVCALLSDNNPNHFSPMLSPPARSGRYTTSAVFAYQQLHLIGFLLFPLPVFLLFCFFTFVLQCMASLILCHCLHFVQIFHVCIIWAIQPIYKIFLYMNNHTFFFTSEALH